jgi:hypothetical protein
VVAQASSKRYQQYMRFSLIRQSVSIMMPLVSLSLILSLFLQLFLSLSLSYTKHAHTNAHTYHLLTHSLTCCVFSQGDVDDIEEISEEFEFWYNYYRSLFPKVTTQQIDEFSAKYKNSEEECNDIIENYNKFNGSMTDIMENVMLAEEEDEARISGIIDAAISSSKLKSTSLYTKYKKSNKKNIKKRKDIDLGDENEDDSNHVAAGPSLAALILNKPSNAKNAFDDIFAKLQHASTIIWAWWIRAANSVN